MLRHEHGDAGNEAEAQILSHLALAQKLLRARDPVAILIVEVRCTRVHLLEPLRPRQRISF